MLKAADGIDLYVTKNAVTRKGLSVIVPALRALGRYAYGRIGSTPRPVSLPRRQRGTPFRGERAISTISGFIREGIL